MNAAAVTVRGQYFDGRQPIGIPATLILGPRKVGLISTSVSARYDPDELRISPRIARADRFISLPDGGQFQCPDVPLLDTLAPDSTTEGWVAWLENRLWVAVAAIVTVIALVLLGYFVGIPRAAEQVTEYIPVETEQVFGEEVLGWLDENEWLLPSKVDPDMLDFIRDEFDELRRGLPLESHYRLEFRDSNFIGANAFALPGGTIVLTDGMVSLAESLNEISAVLAHEIGHVEKRHVMRNFLQSSVIALLTATISGDAASLSVAVSGAPVLLAQAKYSREFETEADSFAFARLKEVGRSPEAFAALMERLAENVGYREDELSLFATHPITAERIARARAAAH